VWLRFVFMNGQVISFLALLYMYMVTVSEFGCQSQLKDPCTIPLIYKDRVKAYQDHCGRDQIVSRFGQINFFFCIS